MSRRMPPLDAYFGQEVRAALDLVEAGEVARTTSGPRSVAWRELHPARLELLYEIALLRAFVEWENFLEASFYRYMCGFQSKFGQATLLTGRYHGSIKAAEGTVLAGRAYVLWHDPTYVVKRAQRFMVGCRHEVVFTSNIARLQDIAALRHRIAHGQEDARLKFDAATMAIAGRRYRASRPGRFLRDWDHSVSPPRRWIESIGSELVKLASQIV